MNRRKTINAIDIAIAAPIQSGAVTHTHDQSMVPVSFNIKKTTNNRNIADTPPLLVCCEDMFCLLL